MTSALETFQAEHGADWSATVQSPAYIAAFTLVNIERLQAIVALTDDEIDRYAKIILADLRGHLKYENALITLHEKKKFVFQDVGPETYPDPAEEAHDAAVAEAKAERQRQDESGPRLFRPQPQENRLPRKPKARKVRALKRKKRP